ncbi:Magnesium transporter MRS2-I [Asimina triloba]
MIHLGCTEVFLRDPTDENVFPIVEELRWRLPPENAMLQQNDAEAAEEDGWSMLLIAGSYYAESPFEFRALEVALEAICSFLDARTTELETAAYPALDELTSKLSLMSHFFTFEEEKT